ncbi:MAG: hypothetical protein A3I75_01645 [Deltaproteobacteria bacterium RIFCSPLOWO2_02_FULL_50_16]|nr:MAG: hypothetical protein A2053_03320 [Deltaproteobacteria bacterium GWA2_50_8]OGQ26054.1 MAG: hypothetical protein A3B79_00310 [Deltaproteobacteria bacterium RIFCSPHIGHO2_02_FULL_50_15]OGQ55815.1 MAG: hypothetical protein A3I75_01645 [Deltaproteobacteria bacterium RIFCSPLOWO2_02_FULL_50_16]OGQ66399.1 MAG: hypothetical protein A3F89_01360 [Deltaproteobacteria bacterium RIFCSPLOWO2_12_FULL_50_11]
MLIDTHAHLTFSDFDGDREAVLTRAHEAGVHSLIVIGSGHGLEINRKALDLAERQKNIWATVGIHPHEAQEADETYWEALHSLISHEKIVAMGEMGLDYYYGKENKPQQQTLLRRQIRMAHESKLPIVIHCRDAEKDMQQILKEEGAEKVGGILHCFTGTRAFAEAMIEENFLISFSGIITFDKKVHDLQETAKALPLEKILVETDCPYLAPPPFRGKRNEPAYVVKIAEKIALLKNVSLEEVAQQTTQNAYKLFRIPSASAIT